MTRYSNLRASIGYFASSPQEQLAHDWGADEAVNELPYPLEIMVETGELTEAEAAIIFPFDHLISRYCSSDRVKPWDDAGALFSDPLWAEIRSLAADILANLPEENREAKSSSPT
ncbi:hypothetical protein [Sphingomonas sp.]